ncbi:hypothetical protein [Moorena sp. SIO3H5]|uniref:hypothetical protein n=1 Tax=Moorena sp. SIO3H5 TaxID=2607834 RepID=UPI0013BD68A1|nr:hypothetical protein [Moorena sp. SIO3H5]NEO72606.1 hypothetical protein [Moorena sp. SIO3H5]
MSPTPKDRIEAFIDLIKYQPFIFLDENRVDLKQQIDKFPEDLESLSNAISSWCVKHPDIFTALRDKLDSLDRMLVSTLIGKQKGPAQSNPKPQPKDYKTLLKNQVRESFPETTSETTKEQKPSDTSK